MVDTSIVDECRRQDEASQVDPEVKRSKTANEMREAGECAKERPNGRGRRPPAASQINAKQEDNMHRYQIEGDHDRRAQPEWRGIGDEYVE